MHTQLGITVDQIKGIEQELQRLQQQTVQKNISRHPPCSTILMELSLIMNDHTRLTQFDMSDDPDERKPVQLKLSGYSGSNSDLGDFMDRLSTRPVFETVMLNYAKKRPSRQPVQSAAPPDAPIRFEIVCTLL